MACPEGRYAAILRTADGLTPEHPYNLTPNIFAVSDWRAIAERAITRAEAAKREYGSFKPAEEWTEAENTMWNTLIEELQAIQERFDNVESVWNIFDWTHASAGSYITDLVAIATDAACMWQKFDEAHEALGGRPHGPPDPGALPKGDMTLFDKALLIGGLIGGGFLAVSLVRTFQNRKDKGVK